MIFSLFAALESGPMAMLISTVIILTLLAIGIRVLRKYSPIAAKIVRVTLGGVFKIAGITEGMEFQIPTPYTMPRSPLAGL